MLRVTLFLLSTITSHAAALISDTSASFTVNVTAYDFRATPWATSYGSYQKDFEHQRVLDVKLRVVGEVEKSFAAVWCFIGQRRDGGGLYVVGSGDSIARLDQGNHAAFQIDSPYMGGTDDRYMALQAREQTGMRPFGWGLCIIQAGRVVASTGSTPECRAYGVTHAQKFLQARAAKKP